MIRLVNPDYKNSYGGKKIKTFKNEIHGLGEIEQNRLNQYDEERQIKYIVEGSWPVQRQEWIRFQDD